MASPTYVPAIALYYPYPFIQNDAWLKRAALYWDKIFRIVPVNFRCAVINEFRVADHTPTARVLIDKLDFIRDYVVPEPELRRMSGTPYHAAAQGLLEVYHANPKRFRREMERTNRAYFTWGEMERGKVNRFAWEFGQLGFLKDATGRKIRPREANPDERLYFHDYPGRVYMCILAKYIAAKLGIPIVTDDPDHDIILKQEALCFGRRFRKHDMVFAADASTKADLELGILDVALQSVQLKDVEEIPPEDIVKIRKEVDEERRAFVTEVRTFVGGFYESLRWCNTIDQARVQNLLEDFGTQIRRRVDALHKALQDAGLETLLELMGISLTLPLTEVVAALIPVNQPLVLAGAATLGLSGVLFRSGRRRNTVFTSEMSTAYLHHVKTATASGYFRRTLEGLESFLLR